MSEIESFKVEPIGIKIDKYQCSRCHIKFGTVGEQSAMVRVVTSVGQDTWCQGCYREGLKKGTCKKFTKMTKAEKKVFKKQRNKVL